jgi:UDPglucose--hexose-1-phosphate uridylyltransferase
MSDLRWHPLLKQWVGVAAVRQDRPQMPKDWCPFDPGSGKVPDHYEVYIYPNDFAAFSRDSPPFDAAASEGLFGQTGARGNCDVVLYSPDHNCLPSELSPAHWRLVVDAWTRRSIELFADPVIQYVFIFENTGVAIGVTMPHPHGQIYAFPYVPPLIETELRSAGEHHSNTGRCLYCDLLGAELQSGSRVVAANGSFVTFVPFAARFPSEVQIYARRHVDRLEDLSDAEKTDLADAIRTMRRKYDSLYGFPLPLMMMVRQAPAKGEHPYFHFHVEFFPIQRSATKLKYLAGVETAAGTFLNDTVAEDQAESLRQSEPKTNSSA